MYALLSSLQYVHLAWHLINYDRLLIKLKYRYSRPFALVLRASSASPEIDRYLRQLHIWRAAALSYVDSCWAASAPQPGLGTLISDLPQEGFAGGSVRESSGRPTGVV